MMFGMRITHPTPFMSAKTTPEPQGQVVVSMFLNIWPAHASKLFNELEKRVESFRNGCAHLRHTIVYNGCESCWAGAPVKYPLTLL